MTGRPTSILIPRSLAFRLRPFPRTPDPGGPAAGEAPPPAAAGPPRPPPAAGAAAGAPPPAAGAAPPPGEPPPAAGGAVGGPPPRPLRPGGVPLRLREPRLPRQQAGVRLHLLRRRVG